MRACLKVSCLEKYYEYNTSRAKVLDDVSFVVDEGEFVCVMGASGTGKTTLLNCIAGIDKVNSGQIFLADREMSLLKENQIVEFRKKNLGFIFQDFNLLDTLTVRENISLILSINGIRKRDILARVQAISESLGIEAVLDKYPTNISGGERQRCACARAIVHEPKLVIADEPTGSLDSKASEVLLELLCHMKNKLKATILVVTHDIQVASFADRILFLGEGKVRKELVKDFEDIKSYKDAIYQEMTM